MNLQQDRTSRIKARNAIMVLTIIAIAMYFISNLLFNVTTADWQAYGVDYYINFIDIIYNIKYAIQFFQLLPLELAAAMLLLVFAIAFKRENKHEILVPIIFGFIAVDYLLYVFTDMGTFFRNADYTNLLFTLFSDLPIVAMCVMSVISSINGMKQKVFPIIVIAIRLLLVLIFSPNPLISAFETSSGKIILYAASAIGAVSCFYVALLLFVITNRIPALVGEKQEMQQVPQQVPQYVPVQDPQQAPQQVPQYVPAQDPQQAPQQAPQYVPVQDPQQAPQQIPQQMYFQQPQQYQQPQQQITYQPLLPEQELAILDDQLRRGMITFEVYQSKRDQIINKIKRF